MKKDKLGFQVHGSLLTCQDAELFKEKVKYYDKVFGYNPETEESSFDKFRMSHQAYLTDNEAGGAIPCYLHYTESKDPEYDEKHPIVGGDWLNRPKDKVVDDKVTEDDVQENINIAIKLKQEGNDLFKAKDYSNALTKYSQIDIYIKSLAPLKDSEKIDGFEIPSLSDEKVKEVHDLQASSHLNQSICYHFLKKYQKSIDSAA